MYPLRPGTTYIYEDSEEGLIDFFQVTREEKVVNGVDVVVVHDTEFVDGDKVEFTEDWFAQDDRGNVWYMGEFSTQYYPDEPGKAPTNEGSWEAGQAVEEADPPQLARPGYAMKAHPQVGDTYNQEYAPGVAEDKATVLDRDASATVDYREFDDGLLKPRTSRPLTRPCLKTSSTRRGSASSWRPMPKASLSSWSRSLSKALPKTTSWTGIPALMHCM